MCADFTFSKSFWTDFVRDFWGKRPTLIKRPFEKPLVTPEEVFDILVRSSSDFKDMTRKVTLSVYVDHGLRSGDARYFLPRPEDGSLAKFAERLKSELGDKAYTLVAYGGHFYNASVWTRCRDFLQGLYEEVGLSVGHANIDIFFGRYPRTPTGIHRDTAHSFSYIVDGPKKMVFWPNEAFREQVLVNLRYLGTDEYERFSRGATVIEAQTGDIVFWPASYWHMAASDGGWPTTVNLGIYALPAPFFFLRDAIESEVSLQRLVQANMVETFPFELETSPAESDIPDCVRKEYNLIRAIGESPDLLMTLKTAWLKRLSASGFTDFPAPRAAESLAGDTLIFGFPRFPIRVMRVYHDTTRVIANGYQFDVPLTEEPGKLVHIINSGERLTVQQLLDRVVGAESPAEPEANSRRILTTLLHQLYSVRSIERA